MAWFGFVGTLSGYVKRANEPNIKKIIVDHDLNALNAKWIWQANELAKNHWVFGKLVEKIKVCANTFQENIQVTPTEHIRDDISNKLYRKAKEISRNLAYP